MAFLKSAGNVLKVLVYSYILAAFIIIAIYVLTVAYVFYWGAGQ